jgi:hypothetical protein
MWAVVTTHIVHVLTGTGLLPVGPGGYGAFARQQPGRSGIHPDGPAEKRSHGTGEVQEGQTSGRLVGQGSAHSRAERGSRSSRSSRSKAGRPPPPGAGREHAGAVAREPGLGAVREPA